MQPSSVTNDAMSHELTNLDGEPLVALAAVPLPPPLSLEAPVGVSASDEAELVGGTYTLDCGRGCLGRVG
jgi:hypothetical protein